MQTRRRTVSLASEIAIASTPKSGMTSFFKHTKDRTSARTLVVKSEARSKVSVTETSTVLIQNDTVTTSVVTKKKQRTQKSKTPSPIEPMDIDPTETATTSPVSTGTAAAKGTKPKVPEENPWTKRPLHAPSYAKEALEHLVKADPALARLITKYPYMIYDDHDTNYFRVLTRTILGQQIHWKAARSIIFKFVSYYYPEQVTLESLDSGDKTFPTPAQVLSTPMDKLRLCGLSERKASYVQDLARHFAEGKITFTDKVTLQSMTDQEIASQLLCVRGIGPWTVDMFMMNSLERLDVLPTLDLGIRKGMEKHFAGEYKNGVWGTVVVTEEDGAKKMKKGAKGKGKTSKGEMSCDDMERMAERWRPYRSIASWYMWRSADEDIITAPV